MTWRWREGAVRMRIPTPLPSAHHEEVHPRRLPARAGFYLQASVLVSLLASSSVPTATTKTA
jgi:hypothetical protein